MELIPIVASAEWRRNSTGWWYEEESSYATGWQLIDGKFYYFSNNGYMMHDTYVEGYKLGPDGAWIENAPRDSTTGSTSENYYTNPVNVQIVRGLETNRDLLSCKYDGTAVDLWSYDDGSGRQRWKIPYIWEPR